MRNPNTIYFWRRVWDVTKIVLIVAALLFAVIGVFSLFDSSPAHKKMDVKYSVGNLGNDGKLDGVVVADPYKNTLVSDFIHVTSFYTEHIVTDKVSDYTIWFYDADRNYISNASFNTGSDPAFYADDAHPMPIRKDADGNIYVDREGKPMAAEYIRITLTPQAEIKFDNLFTNWINCNFVYKDVVRVMGSVREQNIDIGDAATTPAYPSGPAATQPAA